VVWWPSNVSSLTEPLQPTRAAHQTYSGSCRAAARAADRQRSALWGGADEEVAEGTAQRLGKGRPEHENYIPTQPRHSVANISQTELTSSWHWEAGPMFGTTSLWVNA
jgi:hypothetical protein